MGKPTGFLEYGRVEPPQREVEERVRDFAEVEELLSPEELRRQAARCMDCGIPFCHAFGCPLANVIPEWNEMAYRGKWRRALELLHATNNFPEVTGRICPAPCEPACTLAINQDAVTIRHIELQIAERGWREGWIEPQPPARSSDRSVAVIGSGPAALAAAQQLARAGHETTAFEKSDRAGGILRYGIPDFKLDKAVLDRRLEQMGREGVSFELGVEVGRDVSARYLLRHFDAVLVCTGAGAPRDLDAPGRDLDGIHFAMDFLTGQNRRNMGEVIAPDERISAEGKRVVVIGGGDTGADCVGTSRRQGAREIVQVELLPEPPRERPADNPWPTWPQVLRSSTSHQEGCRRLWSVLTREALGREGCVRALRCVRLDWSAPDEGGRRSFREVPGAQFDLPAELVILAMGFVHTEHGGLVEELDLETDARGNLATDERGMTSATGVFAAGDSAVGASLVVRAIAAGRRVAASVGDYLDRLA